jgi:hypothetical protein
MDNPPETPPEWIADLLASRAEADRGEQIPMQPLLDRMQAAIDRITARKHKR